MDRRFQSRHWPSAFGARGSAVVLACSSFGLTLGVAALFASSAPSFSAARNYPTGREPASVAIGDLNGDRKPDLVTANYGDGVNTVSVLANRGDGSFRAKLDYRTGGGPFSVAIGDLNGDGRPDLATANSYNPDANTVSVLLNGGGGSFQAQVNYGTGGGPSSVAIGDLNGDRRPDLATANQIANTVSVLLNRGDGSFQAKLDYPTGHGPYSLAIGDLNGDRTPDLATANAGPEDNPGRTVSVLLNRGDGSFQAKRDYRTGWNPTAVAIGDLNGDRRPDLAIANDFASAVSVLLNRGDGSFRAKRDYATGRGPYSVVIGDLNGDRKPDLATAYPNANIVSVLVNRGDGSFRAKLDYGTGGGPYSVAIGDLNRDGKQDVVTANIGMGGNQRGKTVSVLLNTPGLCTVQEVKAQTLPAAKRTIARANCRVGKIRRAYSNVRRGRVTSQQPKFGTVLPDGGKVNLVLSRGRKP